MASVSASMIGGLFLIGAISSRLEVLAAIVPQSKVQAFSGGGLFDNVSMPFELASNRRADEIGPV